jgi:deoxycytidylate deaminase
MTPFEAMQAAVDVVLTSEHIKNKIAACLFTDKDHIVGTNHRPAKLKNSFTPDIRVGDSSQFIHAEVGCIYKSNIATDESSLCVTDPFCPNCAKAIAESGIRHVYIDHKGLDKDFAKRRGEDFESLSLLIMEKAGIHVSILYRKEQRIEPLLTPPIMTRIATTGLEFFDCVDDLPMADIMSSFRKRQPKSAWACARVKESNGKTTGILIFEGLPPGLTPHDYVDKKSKGHGTEKYGMTIDPMNRLMFYLKRKNMALLNSEIGCNLTPSSRAFVNAIGFGVQKITIGHNDTAIGTPDVSAIQILDKNGILQLSGL